MNSIIFLNFFYLLKSFYCNRTEPSGLLQMDLNDSCSMVGLLLHRNSDPPAFDCTAYT